MQSVVVGSETGLVRSFKFSLPKPKLGEKKPEASRDGIDEFGAIGANLSELASYVSGHWRGIDGEGLPGKHLKTEAWFAQGGGGTRIGPKDWGFEGSRAPLIHEVCSLYSIFRSRHHY